MSAVSYNLIYSNARSYRIKRHLLFWLACVLFFTLIYGSLPLGTRSLPAGFHPLEAYLIASIQAVFFLPLHICLSYTIMYVLVPRYFFKEKYGQLLLWLCLSFLCTGVFSSFLSEWIVGPVTSLLGAASKKQSFGLALMAGLRGGITVSGFAVAIKLGKFWYHKNQLNKQLEAEKLVAELQVLKAQVHPHFLFNTLNNLYALTLQQSQQAPEVVLKLSGLLRYMLYECNVASVPLLKELQLMNDYIELEKLRYGERLDFSLTIEGNPAGIKIAPLLLLPLLENSFKHGASEKLDQAWISLSLRIIGKELRVKLMNGIAEGPVRASTNGIGLQNVKKRLSLLYPNQHELKLTRDAEVFIVSLNIQLEEESENASPPIIPLSTDSANLVTTTYA
jgi:hypothetical protein